MNTCGHEKANVEFGKLRLCEACANSDEYAKQRRVFRRHMGTVLTVERAELLLKTAQIINEEHRSAEARRIYDTISLAALEESALGFAKIAQHLSKIALEILKLIA